MGLHMADLCLKDNGTETGIYCKPANGGGWCMITVTSSDLLQTARTFTKLSE